MNERKHLWRCTATHYKSYPALISEKLNSFEIRLTVGQKLRFIINHAITAHMTNFNTRDLNVFVAGYHSGAFPYFEM